MSELTKIIENWPVLIQGALGSALFAVTLLLLQIIYKYAIHRISSLSKKRQISELTNEKIKIGMRILQSQDKAMLAAPLLYRMSRPLIKALLWLVLGILFGQILNVLMVIGCIGSVYYLIIALDIVSAYNYDGDLDERMIEIKEKIKELKENV